MIILSMGVGSQKLLNGDECIYGALCRCVTTFHCGTGLATNVLAIQMRKYEGRGEKFVILNKTA
jgi:hypothetical protein